MYRLRTSEHSAQSARGGRMRRQPSMWQHKKTDLHTASLFPGGLEGDRTLDLCDANAALSQLSYEPILAVFHQKKLRKTDF